MCFKFYRNIITINLYFFALHRIINYSLFLVFTFNEERKALFNICIIFKTEDMSNFYQLVAQRIENRFDNHQSTTEKVENKKRSKFKKRKFNWIMELC